MVRFKACAATAVASALLLCGKASALIVWSGADAPGNTNWSDTLDNWGVESFSSSDVLTIDLSLSPTNQVVSTVDSSFSINSLLILSSNGTNGLLLDGAGSLGIASGGSLENSSSSPVTVSAAITGAGNVVNNGGGTLTLSGSNSYTGGTTISSGTLAIGSDSALGTGTLMLSGGTNFTTTDSSCFDITNDITLCSGGTVTLLGGSMGTMLELDGTITGSSRLEIAAAGGDGTNTVTLTSGSNSFSGGVSVDAGNTNLVVGSNYALGTGTLMLSDGNNFTTIDGSCYNISNDITLCGSGPSVNLLKGGTGKMLTLSGMISGSAGFDIAAPGDGINTVTLTSNCNNFSGGVTVEAGDTNLVVGSNNALGTGMLTLSDGNNFTTTGSGCFVIGNSITLADGGTVTLLGGGMGTMLELDGMITGCSALEIAAPGCSGTNYVNLTSGCSTFSGGVRVDEGYTALEVGSSSVGTGSGVTQGPLGTGTLMLSANNDFETTGSGCITIGNNISLCDGGTVYLEAVNGGNMLTLGGMISGSSTLDVGIPGTYTNYLALTSGCSTFSGGVRVEEGDTTLAVGASSQSEGSVYQGPLGTGTLMLSNGNNFTTTGSGCFTIGNDITLCGGGTVTLLGNSMGTMLTLTGMIYGSSGLEIAAPGCGGADIVTLTSGCSTFSGGVTVDAGNTTLVVGGNGSGVAGDISSGPLGIGTLTLGNGTTLTTPMCSPFTVLNDIVIGTGSGCNTVTLGSTSGGTSGLMTLMGSISQYCGPGALVVNGPVDFEGNNSYSGGTTVNWTTVSVGTDTGLGTGPLTANGSTINFNTASPTINGLTLMCASTVNFENNSTPTIIGMASDNSSSGNVINLGGADSTTHLTIQVDTDPTYYGSITGHGSLSVTTGSSGELDLYGSNSYDGQTTIGSNTLVVAGNNSAFGTGPVAVNSGGTLGLDTGVTITNQVALSDGGKVGGYGTIAPGLADTISVQGGSGITGGRGTIGGGDLEHPIVGTLSFGSNVALEFGGGGAMQFSIMNAGGTAGTDYSTINVAGNLNITANAGSQFTIQLVGVDSTGQIVGSPNSFNASQAYSWTLLSAGSISNFNSSAFAVDAGSFFTSPAGDFIVSQTGNDLMLNFTPVPEPSTWALMVSGLFAAGAAYRRRRR